MSSDVPELETLRKAYCPPVDDATFYAISSDFDLPQDHDSLIAILDELKAGAEVEERTTFDPSGTGGAAPLNDETDASHTTSGAPSTSNDVTSVTTGLTDLNIRGLGEDINSLSVEERTKYLANLFPTLSADLIATALDNGSSVDQAIDELLNLSFLGNDNDDSAEYYQTRPKGIDGFAEQLKSTQRKGRGKKKSRTNESSRASSTASFGTDSPASSNMWNESAGDIEFICSRTMLTPQAARSVYHVNGARLQPTLRALAEKYGAAYRIIENTDPIIRFQLSEFKTDFETVPELQMYGLLTLARNMPSATYELLEAMTLSNSEEHVQAGKLYGMATYAPIDLEPKDRPTDATDSAAWTTVQHGDNRQLATVHGVAASQAFSQAQNAYRKSRSDRLMGGAAAYYASVGHERLKTAKAMNAAAADAHVTAQSSRTVLDLHGASVADAVRIANTSTNAWYDGLGEAKYASGGGGPVRAGYRIVTGIGSHSRNHAPRIGPAVSKALIREGWKVEIGHGELVVTGKVRR